MSESTFDILSLDWGGLRPDLVTRRQATAQGERVLVRDPESGKTFLFSESAFRVLSSLESGKPARDSIAAIFSGGVEKAPGTARLVAQAHAASLLTGGAVAPHHTEASLAKPSGTVARAARWNPFYIRVPLFNPQAGVRFLRPLAGLLFHRLTVLLTMLALAALLGASYGAWNRFGRELQVFRSFAWWPAVYTALAVSAILHETAHVMVCDRFGISVKQVGLLFYFFQPGAYADVSEAWMLPERGKRAAIALAGVYVESILWIVATAYWLAAPAGVLHQIAFVAGLCLSTRIVLNLIPFLRLDGYWVLSDLLGMPNLRSFAFDYLAAMVPGVGRRVGRRPRGGRKERIILLVYGSLGLLSGGLATVFAYRNICRWFQSLWPHWSAVLSWSFAVVVLTLAGLNVWYRFAGNPAKSR